ncbi:MAG: hypothetical protein M0Z65_10390 [Firmicutes bacterium]|nr:hypothetical protein [Bacillota bacterium]
MIGLPKIPSKKDVFVVKRAQEKESGHPFVAKLKFEDRNLRFEMCLTAEEADIYQNAQSTYEKIKESHPDPAEVKHWKEQKFISLHEHFGEKIRRYSSMAQYDPALRQSAVETCQLQIQFAPVAKNSFKNDPYTDELPEHMGYSCLIQWMEEEGKFGEALYLTRLARDEGWRGNWKEIEERLRRKMDGSFIESD